MALSFLLTTGKGFGYQLPHSQQVRAPATSMGASGDAGLLWGTAGKKHRAAEAVEPASWAGVMYRVTSKSGLLGLPGLSVAKH